MREIKFRGIDSHCNTWKYGYYLEKELCDGKGRQSYIKKDGYTEMPVKSDTIGQYTGLTDKNGTEIYEGDIVLCKEYKNLGMSIFTSDEREIFSLEDYKGECEEIYTSQIFYDEANFYVNQGGSCEVPLCCFFGNMKNSNPIFEIEVIGNIYDNSEMLESNQ